MKRSVSSLARASAIGINKNYGKPVKSIGVRLGGTRRSCVIWKRLFLLLPRLWQRSGKEWPGAATQRLMDSHSTPDGSSIDALNKPFVHRRSGIFSANIECFFGGGEYDHSRAYKRGLTVPPWPEDKPPSGLFNQDASK